MKTVWEYSPRTETLRLLYTAKNIASGFYRLNNFIILPPDLHKPGGNIVVFPDLKYFTVPRFWDRVSRLHGRIIPSAKTNIPEDLIRSTEKLLPSGYLTKIQNISEIQDEWDLHQSRILAGISGLIPQTQDMIESLTIWPTRFGTTCSFNVCDKPPYHIYLWLRTGCGLAEIVEAILTSVTRNYIYENLGGLWSESEMIVDWLMTQSSLAPVLSSVGIDLSKIGTLKAVRVKQQADVIRKSQEYLTRIGAPQADLTRIKALDTGKFSSGEKRLFNLLVSKSPQVVSFDEIHNELRATGDEFFSLYAISKSVQRLRDRLEESGISGSFIQTQRGQGYLLRV